MTIQLNFGEHVSVVPMFVPLPPGCRPDAQWARAKAIAIARSKPSANTFFKSLPEGRSLSALLADRSIWVNYYIDVAMGMSTVVEASKEIGITNSSFRKGKWTVLATLIHELAHINGAPGHAPDEPGQPFNTLAEDALVHCGLGTQAELRTRVNDPKTPYEP